MAKVIFIIAMITGITGAAVRPVVTFTPTWNKILYGDSVTMTCDVDAAVPGNLTYTWYRNKQWLHTGKTFTIQSAQYRHGGNYQCGTSEDNISEVITLNVTRGPVVLQSPPYIYEGDDLLLRCHSGSKNTTGPIEYYRNNEMIHSSDTDSEFLVGNHSDVTAVYKCTKQVIIIDYGIYSDETDFRVQEMSSVWKLLSWWTGPNGKGKENDFDQRDVTGAAASVMVTFSPNWRRIFIGESMTMMCNGSQYRTYSWYKDNTLLRETNQNTMEIHSAQRSDSGTYQCRTNSGRSPAVLLDVILGPVILQAPLHVSDGHDIHLRCHSPPEYYVQWTKFYKDNKLLQDSGDGRLLLTQADASGRYRCEKSLYHFASYTDSVSVPIREPFSSPEINLTLPVITEGDTMTLTCDTSPLRPTTELHFAFYRDGQEVRGFISSNKYEVLSTRLEDSGNYSCTGRTLDRRVLKTSQELHVQIHKLFSSPEINLTLPVITEGDAMTLTCDTSPRRPTTELHFAFYRDGQEVRGFNTSNKYEVPSTRLEDSGNYSCTGRTLDKRVLKTSQELYVQIHALIEMDGHQYHRYLYPTVSIILLLILIISTVLIFRHRHQFSRLFPKRNQTRDPQPVHGLETNFAGEEENNYMEVRPSQIDPTDASDVCYSTLNFPTKASSLIVTDNVIYSAVQMKVSG